MRDFKYIDIIDLPSDPTGSLGATRRAIMMAYNHNRGNQAKLRLLADTMAYVIKQITTGLEQPDPDEIINYHAYLNDQKIATKEVTKGFTKTKKTKPKPTTRAAKRIK